MTDGTDPESDRGRIINHQLNQIKEGICHKFKKIAITCILQYNSNGNVKGIKKSTKKQKLVKLQRHLY